MSAHRVLKDLFKAFTTIGPGIVEDPGNAGTITFDSQLQICELTSAAAETRTLARPDRSGIRAVVRFYSDGGTITLTVTGGMNVDGDTVATLADAGDFLSLLSVRSSATAFRWEVLEGNYGTVVTSATPSSTPSRTPSHTVSSTPSHTVSSTPSRTPSHTVSSTPSHTVSSTPSRTPSHTVSSTPSHTPSST